MATINIEGVGRVQLDDSFRSLSPEQQESTIAEIAASKKPQTPSVGYGEDIVKSLGSGLVKGAAGIAGLPSAIGDLAQWGERKLLGENPEQYATRLEERKRRAILPDVLPSTEQVIGAIESNVTGPLYKPQTTPGQFAQTVGEFLPGAAMGPGGIARNIGMGIAGGLGSETAGQAAQGTDYEGAARIVGGLAAPLTVAAGRRAVTPFPATAERQAANQALEAEGVRLTAGQRTGSKPLQYLESESGTAGQRAVEAQKEQFTRAVLRRAGEDAPRATPDVIDGAFTRLGAEFDGLAARNVLRGDRGMVTELTRVWGEYTSLVPQSARAPVVENVLQDITNAVRNQAGVMSGQSYQALRSRLDRLARSSVRDPQLSDALYGIRNALDNAMERGLRRSGSPDLGHWRNIRRQYRNLIPIAKAVEGGGEDVAQGLLSPAKMRQTTVNAQGGRNYARGQGDLADIVRAGNVTMTPLPQSGTAPRLAAQTLLGAPGAAIGYDQGGATGAGVGAALGFLGGRYLAGRGLMSRPAQSYLGNQTLPPPAADPLRALAGVPGTGGGVIPQLSFTPDGLPFYER